VALVNNIKAVVTILSMRALAGDYPDSLWQSLENSALIIGEKRGRVKLYLSVPFGVTQLE
jgi:hypothetical protein